MNNLNLPDLEMINGVYDNLQRANMNVTIATMQVWERKRKLEKECAAIIEGGALNIKEKYPTEAARSAALQVFTQETADSLHEAEMNLMQHKSDLKEAEIERDRLEMTMKLAQMQHKSDLKEAEIERDRLEMTMKLAQMQQPYYGYPLTGTGYFNPLPLVPFTYSGDLPQDSMTLDDKEASG
jgi:hypothetical protein